MLVVFRAMLFTMKTWKAIIRVSVVAVLSAVFVLPMAGSVAVPQADALGIVVHPSSEMGHSSHCEGEACGSVQEQCALHCLQQPVSDPVESISVPVVTKVVALVVPFVPVRALVIADADVGAIDRVPITPISTRILVLRE